jgi:hypothetical protein
VAVFIQEQDYPAITGYFLPIAPYFATISNPLTGSVDGTEVIDILAKSSWLDEWMHAVDNTRFIFTHTHTRTGPKGTSSPLLLLHCFNTLWAGGCEFFGLLYDPRYCVAARPRLANEMTELQRVPGFFDIVLFCQPQPFIQLRVASVHLHPNDPTAVKELSRLFDHYGIAGEVDLLLGDFNFKKKTWPSYVIPPPPSHVPLLFAHFFDV